MSWGVLIPPEQRRAPRAKIIAPWFWDVATLILGMALIIGLIATIVVWPDALQDLRGWHIALVPGR